MALNFPEDTSNPYVDPSSGIKYVYNTTIGAWEAALQPPVIMSDSQPNLEIEGFLWWDTDNLQLYVFQGGAWRTAGAPAGGAGATVTVSDAAPVGPGLGDLWWDSSEGTLFVYYIDPDGGSFWTEASQPMQSGDIAVTSSDTAPEGAQEGDMWLNTTTNILYVRHNNAWEITQPPSTGVESISGTAPIVVGGTASDPIVSIGNSTTTTEGIIRIATQAEVNVGTVNNAAVTPATLAATINTNTVTPPYSTDSTSGVIQLATSAEALAGIEDTHAMTPELVAQAITAIAGSLGNPAGTIITFGAATPPSGYLECNGAVLSRAGYADLFAAIGIQYGAGNGSTTFQIPDLRGEFVRGWDNGRGVDSGRALASIQNSELGTHGHTSSLNDPGHTHSISGGTTANLGPYTAGGGSPSGTSSLTTSTTGVSVTVNDYSGSETRPRNVSVLYCIKF